MPSGRKGAAEGGGQVMAVVPGVKIILIGEVCGVTVSSSRDAGGAGQEVAHVGEGGGRGQGVAVHHPTGVRARGGGGLIVQQGAGGAAGGRSGGGHVKAFAFAQLNRRDGVTWHGGEERL